jgi:hypothetical protein
MREEGKKEERMIKEKKRWRGGKKKRDRGKEMIGT